MYFSRSVSSRACSFARCALNSLRQVPKRRLIIVSRIETDSPRLLNGRLSNSARCPGVRSGHPSRTFPAIYAISPGPNRPLNAENASAIRPIFITGLLTTSRLITEFASDVVIISGSSTCSIVTKS